MKKIIVLLQVSVIISAVINATSVNVSGSLSTDTHWTGIDTVKITNDVTIDNGVTLTIDPGIVVEVQGMYFIDVQGRIVAIGNETDSICFTALDKVNGWNRILFVGTPATNDSTFFKYCIFEYGMPVNNAVANKEGGALYLNGFEKIIVSNCLFRHNEGTNAVVYLVNSRMLLEGCTFTSNNGYSFLASGAKESHVINNSFIDNTGTAIYSGNGDYSFYLGNLIKGNSSGFYGYASLADLANNTIVDNASSGLLLNADSDIDVYNTIIYNNLFQVNILNDDTDPNFLYCNIEGDTAAFTGVGSGALFTGLYAQNINEDPLFINPSIDDYRLPRSSPCINTGVFLGYLPETDLEGKPRISEDYIDIGAFEFYVPVDTVCNETWTASESPYYIDSNIYIPDGCSLVIEPGVEVIFNGFYKIWVKGSIQAIGTEEDSITFTAANTSEGWLGIKFIGNTSADSSYLQYCIVEYALPQTYARYVHSEAAISVYDYHKLVFSNSAVRYNNGYVAVVYLSNSAIKLLNNTFSNNTNYSFMALGAYRSDVTGNTFINNASSTALYSGYSDSTFYTNNVIANNNGGIFMYSSEATLVNNTIIDNYFGLRMNMNSNIPVYNTIIRGNTLSQVSLHNDNSDPSFYHCNIEGDTAGFDGPGAHEYFAGDYINCIDADPMFIDPESGNYFIPNSSPCVNKGIFDTTDLNLPGTDFAGYSRIDNDTIDIGAYESDLTPPVADIMVNYPLSDDVSIIFDVYFSEYVTGLELSDFSVDNGTIDNLYAETEGTWYSIEVSDFAVGPVTLELAAGSVIDRAINTNLAASGTYEYIPIDIHENSYSNIIVYPNPVKELLHIESDAEASVTVYDITGNIVLEEENILNGDIDIRHLPAGIYVIQVRISEKTNIFRIVKD